jgi:hypothetical protein
MFRALINIAIDVNQFAFGKKKLCEILTRDLMVLVFSFTIIAVPLSSLLFVDFTEANSTLHGKTGE